MTDDVKNPSHYNNHPSDIKCRQITENLNGNLSPVFKYVFRHEHKGEPIKDIRKAIEYLGYENSALLRANKTGKKRSLFQWEEKDNLLDLIRRVRDCEQTEFLVKFYEHFIEALLNRTHARRAVSLSTASGYLLRYVEGREKSFTQNNPDMEVK